MKSLYEKLLSKTIFRTGDIVVYNGDGYEDDFDSEERAEHRSKIFEIDLLTFDGEMRFFLRNHGGTFSSKDFRRATPLEIILYRYHTQYH